jgi:hypothetical protein
MDNKMFVNELRNHFKILRKWLVLRLFATTASFKPITSGTFPELNHQKEEKVN